MPAVEGQSGQAFFNRQKEILGSRIELIDRQENTHMLMALMALSIVQRPSEARRINPGPIARLLRSLGEAQAEKKSTLTNRIFIERAGGQGILRLRGGGLVDPTEFHFFGFTE